MFDSQPTFQTSSNRLNFTLFKRCWHCLYFALLFKMKFHHAILDSSQTSVTKRDRERFRFDDDVCKHFLSFPLFNECLFLIETVYLILPFFCLVLPLTWVALNLYFFFFFCWCKSQWRISYLLQVFCLLFLFERERERPRERERDEEVGDTKCVQ